MIYIMSGDEGGGPNVYLDAINNEFAMIQEGRFIADLKKEHIELPFEFSMKIRANPDESIQEPRLEAYSPAKELMRKDLVQALQDAGVDNLQVFPAVLSHKEKGLLIHDYVVVNIVGLVSCAAVDDSDAIPIAGGYYFNELVINAADTNGLLMFRLAESKMDVLVHESVAKKIMAYNFPYLVFTPLAEV